MSVHLFSATDRQIYVNFVLGGFTNICPGN